MILDNLDFEEKELYKKVVELNQRKLRTETKEEFEEIHSSYRQIHRQYSELAQTDIEALKRGLFIQWFALTEPQFLAGISNLDEKSEIKLIEKLNELLECNNLDKELEYMLTHYTYSTWDWVFKRFEKYNGLKKFMENRKDNNFPKTVDKKNMEKRGRMGQYWCSFFKD